MSENIEQLLVKYCTNFSKSLTKCTYFKKHMGQFSQNILPFGTLSIKCITSLVGYPHTLSHFNDKSKALKRIRTRPRPK